MKKITVNNIKEWMKSIDENKWRKTYNVDARRIAHFVNCGEGVKLPESLQKKSKSANYMREMDMAKRYLRHLKEQSKRKNNLKIENYLRGKIRKLLRNG